MLKAPPELQQPKGRGNAPCPILSCLLGKRGKPQRPGTPFLDLVYTFTKIFFRYSTQTGTKQTAVEIRENISARQPGSGICMKAWRYTILSGHTFILPEWKVNRSNAPGSNSLIMSATIAFDSKTSHGQSAALPFRVLPQPSGPPPSRPAPAAPATVQPPPVQLLIHLRQERIKKRLRPPLQKALRREP